MKPIANNPSAVGPAAAPASDVLIVGAGLAGLSCAFELADAGKSVVLLEAAPFLGGRTSSWTDPDGMAVESGLHRMVGAYTAMPKLLERAGIAMDRVVVWEDEVLFRPVPPTPSARFAVSPGQHPFKLVVDALGHGDYLPAAAKLSLAKVLTAGLARHKKDPHGLDQLSLLDFAVAHNAHPDAIAHILDPLASGIYFVPASRLSANAFVALIAPYLPTSLKMNIGAFAGGMTEVLADPLALAIQRRGGRVIAGAPVQELIVSGGRVTGARATVANRQVECLARHVVLATSLRTTQRLVAPLAPGSDWANLVQSLGTMPAVTVQLELDGPSMERDITTFGVGTSLACFSEQSRTTYRGLSGRLSVIMAPSDEYVALADAHVIEHVISDADRLGLRVRGHVKRSRVVRHVDDFYALGPGNDHLRPDQATPIPGLTLAGDYTRQPYIATMEGAVRSGQLAAEVAVAAGL